MERDIHHWPLVFTHTHTHKHTYSAEKQNKELPTYTDEVEGCVPQSPQPAQCCGAGEGGTPLGFPCSQEQPSTLTFRAL